MNCEHLQGLLEAYHDREVDAERATVVERHVVGCAECAAELRRLGALRAALSAEEMRYRAPTRLTRSLDAVPDRRRSPLGFAGGALVGFAVASLAFLAVGLPRGPSFENALVDEHVRSNLANHLLDVASSDRHTVKPWFRGKLDFSPPMPDLKSEGFPLLGGRLDYFDGSPAAALVYGRRKHVINLYVLRTYESGSPHAQIRGYSIVHWNQADLSFWAVSDVSREDLQAFAAAFRRG